MQKQLDWGKIYLLSNFLSSNTLSFYGSKIILDRPNNFGWVPIFLDESNLFWFGPNHFGQVQIIEITPEKYNLNLTKMIWTRPKRFGPDQKNLYSSKTIWTVQNHFGPIEGQGINLKSKLHKKLKIAKVLHLMYEAPKAHY